jgi:hypothetical protein
MSKMTHLQEHDRHRRQPLHYVVTLWNPRDGAVLSGLTNDISCRDFCCTCSPGQTYAAGDAYYATIELGCKPDGATQMDRDDLLLHCTVEVARSIPDAGHDRAQVAFFIKDYFITPVSVWQAAEHLARLELQRTDTVQR